MEREGDEDSLKRPGNKTERNLVYRNRTRLSTFRPFRSFSRGGADTETDKDLSESAILVQSREKNTRFHTGFSRHTNEGESRQASLVQLSSLSSSFRQGGGVNGEEDESNDLIRNDKNRGRYGEGKESDSHFNDLRHLSASEGTIPVVNDNNAGATSFGLAHEVHLVTDQVKTSTVNIKGERNAGVFEDWNKVDIGEMLRLKK